jgi:prolyl oligopeptidase
VRDVDSGEDLPDVIEWSKFHCVVVAGRVGFYYSRYDAPEAGQPTRASTLHKVYLHRLGESQSQDRLITSGPISKGGVSAK